MNQIKHQKFSCDVQEKSRNQYDSLPLNMADEVKVHTVKTSFETTAGVRDHWRGFQL